MKKKTEPNSEVLPTELASICDCSRSAVSKARRAGRVHVDEEGMVPLDHVTNRFFIQQAQYRKAEEMMLSGKVAPGWSAICVPLPERTRPVFFIPPDERAENVLSHDEFFDEWKFDPEEWIAVDPEGRKHRMSFVYDHRNPPPWLDEDVIDIPEGRSPDHARGRGPRPRPSRHAAARRSKQ